MRGNQFEGLSIVVMCEAQGLAQTKTTRTAIPMKKANCMKKARLHEEGKIAVDCPGTNKQGCMQCRW